MCHTSWKRRARLEIMENGPASYHFAVSKPVISKPVISKPVISKPMGIEPVVIETHMCITWLASDKWSSVNCRSPIHTDNMHTIRRQAESVNISFGTKAWIRVTVINKSINANGTGAYDIREIRVILNPNAAVVVRRTAPASGNVAC